MTDDEWQKLYENFETFSLLNAVDHIDELRGHLADGEYARPPQIRGDLLKLHSMAMNVVNNGSRRELRDMTNLLFEIEAQIGDMQEAINAIDKTLRELVALLPESTFDDEDDDDLDD